MSGKSFAQDYTQMCRTCLQSDVEMISLSAFIIDNIKEDTSKISYMDCLKMWIQIEELSNVQLPQKICLECASALQVAYWFTKNASQAQELLKIKLEDVRRKTIEIESESLTEDDKKPKRYRCKICNAKVETKRSLKDHIKLHLDIIVYNCQMCAFESNGRNSLAEHYIQIHGVEATKEQLKPRTKLSSKSTSSNVTPNDQTGSDTQHQYFQVLTEDSQQIACQTFANPVSAANTSYSTEPLQISALITTNSNYTNISAPFDALDGELSSDVKLANEFMVMADGSLEKVLNKGVVIEYINAQNNIDLKMDNGLVLDNIIQLQGIDSAGMLGQQNIGQMDIDDIIIEEPCDTTDEMDGNVILPLDEETIPANFIEQPKKIMCKICTKDFMTQEQLKNHMLTHNEIPHFFCDQCKFYTFFKIDLHQHYKSKHNLQPTNKQLQPKNKQKTIDGLYPCNLCLFEADEQLDLKNHYIMKHNIEDIEIHMKSLRSEKLKSKPSAKTKTVVVGNKTTTSTSKHFRNKSTEAAAPDYPNGLNCRKCHELFYFRNKLYEHYKLHNAEEAAKKQEKQSTKIQSKTTSSNLYQNNIKNANATTVQTINNAQNPLESNKSNFSNIGSLNVNVTTPPDISTHNQVAPLTPSSSSTYTLPSDAIPQIVETDQTIENMDFEFNCDEDALFGDFDDVDVENDNDENDSELQNVLLTSDDDFEDMLGDQDDATDASAEASATRSYCAHCQKSFLSQYQFENHMFVHRGLAPYRCEMCTNIYNTKRCLIRHYRAVHKNVPTRDMIQAKGDKVCDDKTVDHSTLEATTCLMCAKCPYESSEWGNIKFHLKSSHNIDDESYIMKKQPFECPRCIRSFASKMKLLSHLDRNHSLTPINQKHRFSSMNNTSELATGDPATPIGIANNHEISDSSASSGKINKVNTSASTTKFLTSNPIQTANVNSYNNHNNPLNSS